MIQHAASRQHATLEEVLENFRSCLSMQRDALVRGDLDALRTIHASLQDAVAQASMHLPLDRLAGHESDRLAPMLREVLSMGTINAGLAMRAESNVRRTLESLGQGPADLYGAKGSTLSAPARHSRSFGA
jgi:uncharacterized protein YaaW (UPF0174 family)